MKPRVIICETCAAPGEAPQGAAFAASLQELVPEGVTVETAACLNQCDKPISMALRAEDRDIYIFHSVDPARDLADAAALARLYLAAEGGSIADARPAGRLRHCLTARVPR